VSMIIFVLFLLLLNFCSWGGICLFYFLCAFYAQTWPKFSRGNVWA